MLGRPQFEAIVCMCVVEDFLGVHLAVCAWDIGESKCIWSVMGAVLAVVVCVWCDGFAFFAEVLLVSFQLLWVCAGAGFVRVV